MTSSRQRDQNAINSAVERPSVLRLVNLALGLGALLSLLGVAELFMPASLHFSSIFYKSSLAGVSPFALVAAHTALDLWLPASALMLIFWICGFHRKLDVPFNLLSSLGLTFAWLALIALFNIDQSRWNGPDAAAVLMLASFFILPLVLAMLLVTTLSALAELVARVRCKDKVKPYLPLSLALWALLPPLVCMVPIALDRHAPHKATQRQKQAFSAMCKEAGVRLMERPAGPVRSIAYDSSALSEGLHERYHIELNSKGRPVQYGGLGNSTGPGKNLDFDFVEHTYNRMSYGKAPQVEYSRTPKRSHPTRIDTFSADVLALSETERMVGGVLQNVVQYRLTLTDRRSGKLRGVHTYFIDNVNDRARGANIPNAISANAFIFAAINR